MPPSHQTSELVHAMEQFDSDELNSTKRRRRLRFWVVGLLTLLLLALLLAPTILTRPVVRSRLLAMVVPSDDIKISLEDFRLGWFAPLQIGHLTVHQSDGQAVLDIARIKADRTLLGLLSDYRNLGTVVVSEPTCHLQLRKDGSNLEDVLAALTSTEADVSTSPNVAEFPFVGEFQVHGGRVVGQATDGEGWTVEQLDVDVVLRGAEPASISCKGTLDGKSFKFQSKLLLHELGGEHVAGSEGSFVFQATTLPLRPLKYVSNRVGQPAELIEGALSVSLSTVWKSDAIDGHAPAYEMIADVSLQNLRIAAQELIGADTLQIDRAQFATMATVDTKGLDIRSCELQSDFGEMSLTSTIPIQWLAEPERLLTELRRQSVNARGTLDLASVTKVLPHTLRIRDDARLSSGKVSWQIESRDDGDDTIWNALVRTHDIRLEKAGEAIDWDFPCEINCKLTCGSEIVINQASLESDFFSLDGHGTLRDGSVEANADVERLAYEIGQVVDLHNVYAGGQLISRVHWNESSGNLVDLNAEALLSQFVMTRDEQILCQEDRLLCNLTAQGRIRNNTLDTVESGRIDIVSAGDFFVAQLDGGVSKPTNEADWNVACRLKGSLTTWFNRLKPLGFGMDFRIAGQVDTNSRFTANTRGMAIHSLVADVSDLRIESDGLVVDEPILQLTTAGTVDFLKYASRFPKTTISSRTIAVNANDVEFRTKPSLSMAGAAGYRTDLRRLTAPLAATMGYQVAGEVEGKLNVTTADEQIRFHLTSEAQQLRVVQNGVETPVWEEPVLLVNTAGVYSSNSDSLQLASTRIQGHVLDVSASGSVAKLTTAPTVDLSGEYRYDVEQLFTRLLPPMGSEVQVTGKRREQFAVKGPLFSETPTDLVSPKLIVQAGLGWQSAVLYQTELGSTHVDVQIDDGKLATNPIRVEVGRGEVACTPTIDLNSRNLMMSLRPQTVVKQLRITPQMTSSWMKYVAPLMADATNADGVFSVTLRKAKIPLYQPLSADVDGDFVIHGGQLGPGPLSSQLIQAASQVKALVGQGNSRIADPTKTWIHLAPQQVRFQVVENRVYHEGFEFLIDDVPVRTRGSVGMNDESISLIADVQILDEWIEKRPNLVGLKGQFISLPIGGTTSHPQLDRRAVAQLSTQLVRFAAQGYLQRQFGDKVRDELGNGSVQDAIDGAGQKLNDKLRGEIGKQLDRLFK